MGAWSIVSCGAGVLFSRHRPHGVCPGRGVCQQLRSWLFLSNVPQNGWARHFLKCIFHYHSPWEKTQGTDFQHILSDFRILGLSLHQCRSSSWDCISGGLLEKQSGHSETQPKIQLSDQGAAEGVGTALPAGHLGSWGSLGEAAPCGVLWAGPGKGSGFCLSVGAGRPGCPVPCRTCGQSFLQGSPGAKRQVSGGLGCSLYLWGVPVQDNFLQVWSGPAHLLHRSSGTSTLCSLRMNWLIL